MWHFIIFSEWGKPEYPVKNSRGARMRTNNKLNPHMTLSMVIEPGPHWWEASAQYFAPQSNHLSGQTNQSFVSVEHEGI